MRCPSLEERNELLKAGPGKFFITPHYDDYPAILVRLSQLDPARWSSSSLNRGGSALPSDCSPGTTQTTRLHRDRRDPQAVPPG